MISRLAFVVVQSLSREQLFVTTWMQQARLTCPSLSPRACSNSCPLSEWCYHSITSFVAQFSCPQYFPTSRSFPMNWFFTSGGQSIGASASPLVLPVNIHGWIPLGLTDLISLLSNRLSRVFSNTTIWKHQFFNAQLFLCSSSHICEMTDGRTIALTRWTFVGKVISLLLNTLSRFAIALLPRGKHLLISWLQSSSTVILEKNKMNSVTVATFTPSIFHEVVGLDVMILIFWMLSFNPAFSLSFFTLIKGF